MTSWTSCCNLESNRPSWLVNKSPATYLYDVIVGTPLGDIDQTLWWLIDALLSSHSSRFLHEVCKSLLCRRGYVFGFDTFSVCFSCYSCWGSKDSGMEKRIELEKRGKNPADVSIFYIFVVIVRILKVSSFIVHVLKTFFTCIVPVSSKIVKYLTFD